MAQTTQHDEPRTPTPPPAPEGRAGDGPVITPAGFTGTGIGSGGFQKVVTTQPAVALPGDFCDANPRASVAAGPGGLVAGTNGVTVGRFAWWDTAGTKDINGTPTIVNNAGAGAPTGFVHREQQALITLYLAYAGNLIPAGFGVTLMTSGGYWVLNTGAASVVGQKAFASLTTGQVQFAAAAGTIAGYVETKYWCMSVGLTNELVKITSYPLG
jgi:hypothetical protein